MAEEQQTPEQPAAEAAPKPSMLPKIMIAGFVSLVVVVETCIFFFMVPSADDVAKLAEARLINKVEENMRGDGEEPVEDEMEQMEFQLGNFGFSFQPPGADRNFSVEFNLVGLVYKKDMEKMEELFEKRQARFQHEVMLNVRNATTEELMENQLGLIQRRIHATSNEVFVDESDENAAPILLGVVFSNPGFQVFEE